ncbi:MAG: YajQ family cyclic di-GMP-binding protein [Deltaproteobacteria bacterium]|nr:YajQ family cyclic di-GMP-binding protein [Deltaproteobacteria bacterium]
MPSFDVVSEVDKQELSNALNQTRKELQIRYDLKQTKSEIQEDPKQNELLVVSDNEFTLKQVTDVLMERMAKRGIPLKNIRLGDVDSGSLGRVKRKVAIQQGIPQETAKQIVKRVKESGMKLQGAIQGDKIRISGKKRDDLQEMIAVFRKEDLGIALQFNNFLD